MIEAADLLANLAEPANSDAALVRRGRYLNTVFLLGIGEASFYITIAAGRVAGIEKAPKLLKAFSFSVKQGATPGTHSGSRFRGLASTTSSLSPRAGTPPSKAT
jgi:hypothetical protein